MIIKSSTSLRNDYSAIANLAKEAQEPICIIKNGEGDLVVMSIEAFEKREEIAETTWLPNAYLPRLPLHLSYCWQDYLYLSCR